MADLAGAEELVRTMERDAAFRAEVGAAPTAAAKRQLLDARGFGDVGFDDMRAWVERQGGTLVIQPGGRELSEEELAAVAGGLSDEHALAVGIGAAVWVVATVAAAY